MNNQDNKWVLITGGAKRIGAEVARTLHARGMNIAIFMPLACNVLATSAPILFAPPVINTHLLSWLFIALF